MAIEARVDDNVFSNILSMPLKNPITIIVRQKTIIHISSSGTKLTTKLLPEGFVDIINTTRVAEETNKSN